MTHYIIQVPGWGTIHGVGTLRQAKEVARLRAKPSRGEPTVITVPKAEVDDRIAWRSLTEVLEEIMEQ